MPEKYNTAIIDTSCFILLEKIDELDLISQVFQSEIVTTSIVAKEFGKNLPEWVKIKHVGDKHYLEFLKLEVDLGEASVIALAFEIRNPILILDDLKARNLAKKLQLNYTGTLGLLLKAKQMGLIPLLSPVLQKIQNTNFRFSDKVFIQILNEAGE